MDECKFERDFASKIYKNVNGLNCRSSQLIFKPYKMTSETKLHSSSFWFHEFIGLKMAESGGGHEGEKGNAEFENEIERRMTAETFWTRFRNKST